jgi:hypothetical protein
MSLHLSKLRLNPAGAAKGSPRSSDNSPSNSTTSSGGRPSPRSRPAGTARGSPRFSDNSPSHSAISGRVRDLRPNTPGAASQSPRASHDFSPPPTISSGGRLHAEPIASGMAGWSSISFDSTSSQSPFRSPGRPTQHLRATDAGIKSPISSENSSRGSLDAMGRTVPRRDRLSRIEDLELTIRATPDGINTAKIRRLISYYDRYLEELRSREEPGSEVADQWQLVAGGKMDQEQLTSHMRQQDERLGLLAKRSYLESALSVKRQPNWFRKEIDRFMEYKFAEMKRELR